MESLHVPYQPLRFQRLTTAPMTTLTPKEIQECVEKADAWAADIRKEVDEALTKPEVKKAIMDSIVEHFGVFYLEHMLRALHVNGMPLDKIKMEYIARRFSAKLSVNITVEDVQWTDVKEKADGE